MDDDVHLLLALTHTAAAVAVVVDVVVVVVVAAAGAAAVIVAVIVVVTRSVCQECASVSFIIEPLTQRTHCQQGTRVQTHRPQQRDQTSAGVADVALLLLMMMMMLLLLLVVVVVAERGECGHAV